MFAISQSPSQTICQTVRTTPNTKGANQNTQINDKKATETGTGKKDALKT